MLKEKVRRFILKWGVAALFGAVMGLSAKWLGAVAGMGRESFVDLLLVVAQVFISVVLFCISFTGLWAFVKLMRSKENWWEP